jgi:formate hydrogenlyase transcriptional activator
MNLAGCPQVRTQDETKHYNELILDLSAKLVSLPPGDLDQAIDRGLELVGACWDVDQIDLISLSNSGSRCRSRFSYFNPEAQGLTIKDPQISWVTEMLGQGKVFRSNRLPEDLPVPVGSDRILEDQGIKSLLALPFKIGDSFQAGLILLSVRSRRRWTDELIHDLLPLGNLLASALARRETMERMNELHRFEHLLAEVSATYINLASNQVEATIRNDLGRLAQLLQADWCGLYLLDEDKKTFRFTPCYCWYPEENRELIVARQRKMDWARFYESLEYSHEKWHKGESIHLTNIDELPPEAEQFRKTLEIIGVKSALSVPISVVGKTMGAVVITNYRGYRNWRKELIPRIRLFGEVFINAVMRKKSEEVVQTMYTEIKQLKEQIEADYTYIKDEISLEHDFGNVVGKSNALKKIFIKVKQVAPTNATVLLLGETGVGKGVIARTIHNRSERKDRPLIQVNCAALAPNLIESELFGYEKGAFTGAHERRIGRFEMAGGTTIFLDEIGELPRELQTKLLRVLHEGEFERVGGSTTLKADARVIAATNRDLQKEVAEDRFRADLWYRLSVFPIFIPPLRERPEDIPVFVKVFVDKYAKQLGKRFDKIPLREIDALQTYLWPGNIRELENIIERAVIMSPDGNLRIEMPEHQCVPCSARKTLEEHERDYIIRTLEDTRWKINGHNGAAELLDIHPETLRSRMRRLGISRPELLVN